MPEYLHPGVYIEEIERGPRPIEGVATSTAAFLGEAERGRTRPRLVTSYSDYLRHFGGVFGPTKYLPYAVAGFFDNSGRRCYIARITAADAATARLEQGDLVLEAIGPGSWGNRVMLRISPSTTIALDPATNTQKPVGFRLQIAYWSTFPGGLPDFDPFDPDNDKKLPRPSAREDFDDLVTDESSPDYFKKRIEGGSALLKVEPKPDVEAPAVPAELAATLLTDGGDGGAIVVGDYLGEAAKVDERRGLEALRLDEYREVAIVYAPAAEKAVIGEIIEHCERQKFRFAVIDSQSDEADANNVNPRNDFDSQYAGFYYPWIKIADPKTGALRKIPPGGHVCGVYARTDIERGVFKAPANEVLRGVLELEYDIDENLQDVLNPRGVNAIRRFPGRGIRIWGARTLSSNALWKYVSVRRLFIFLEASIYEGTQWVVFEPNDERLWDRVKDTIRVFLRGQWRLGALMGRTEQEAFFVVCDRTTMTQDDILNGRLICEIGIAPVRPAEFVIFRIFQNTVEAKA